MEGWGYFRLTGLSSRGLPAQPSPAQPSPPTENGIDSETGPEPQVNDSFVR